MAYLTKAEFTRPTDANAYAIGDIISNSTSAGVAMNFGVGGAKLIRVSLLKSTNAVDLLTKLALFSSDPGAQLDNAAFGLTYANRDTYLTTLTVGTPVVTGSIAHTELVLAQPLSINAGSLYGVLIANAAVAAGNGEQFSLRLHFL